MVVRSLQRVRAFLQAKRGRRALKILVALFLVHVVVQAGFFVVAIRLYRTQGIEVPSGELARRAVLFVLVTPAGIYLCLLLLLLLTVGLWRGSEHYWRRYEGQADAVAQADPGRR
jgi:hypothetical protein